MNQNPENNYREQLVAIALHPVNDSRDPSIDEDAATQVLTRCEIDFRELIHQIINPSLFEPISTLIAEPRATIATGVRIEEGSIARIWDVRPAQSNIVIASGVSRTEAICKAALELYDRSLNPASKSSN